MPVVTGESLRARLERVDTAPISTDVLPDLVVENRSEEMRRRAAQR